MAERPTLTKARREWLAGLQTGDEVAVEMHSHEPPRLAAITRNREEFRVSGMGRNNYGMRFSPASGFQPKNNYGGGAAWISPVSDEIRQAVERAQTIARCREMMLDMSRWGSAGLDRADDATLRELHAILTRLADRKEAR